MNKEKLVLGRFWQDKKGEMGEESGGMGTLARWILYLLVLLLFFGLIYLFASSGNNAVEIGIKNIFRMG